MKKYIHKGTEKPMPRLPSETPRSNAACAAWESGLGNGPSVGLEFAQTLERELTSKGEACQVWIKIVKGAANKLNAKVHECDRLRAALCAYVNADDWDAHLEQQAIAALTPIE